MSKIKGSVVQTLSAFVKEKFGDDGFNKWLNSLSPEAKKVHEQRVIMATEYFPIKTILKEPTEKICELFYRGDLKKGSFESGHFAASKTFRGVYKMIIKIGSPDFLISKVCSILPKIFDQGDFNILKLDDGRTAIRISNLPDFDEIMETRFKGQVVAALEICGCTGLKVEITKSMAKADQYTEIAAAWD